MKGKGMKRRAQAFIEYVLILALVACISIPILSILGLQVRGVLLTTTQKLYRSQQYYNSETTTGMHSEYGTIITPDRYGIDYYNQQQF